MTRKTFYRRLRKVAPEFIWEVHGSFIRATNADSKCFCPITAIHYADTGEYRLTSSFHSAGREIGLGHDDTTTIVDAADNREASGKYHPATRKALLRAVGLA